MNAQNPKPKRSFLYSIMCAYTQFLLSGGGRGGLGESGRNGFLAVLCVIGLVVAGMQGGAVVTALQHGSGLNGVVQWQGRGINMVITPIQTVIKMTVGIGLVSLLILVSIIAYWCGLLDQFDDEITDQF